MLCAMPWQAIASESPETITLASIEWEPFYGSNLPDHGYFAVITKEAFELAGYELKLEYVSWKRAVSGTYAGLYDGLLGSFYHKDRAEHVVYTDPIAVTEQVFVKSKVSKIDWKGMQDLPNLRLAAYAESITLNELVKEGLTVESIPEYKMAIKMLLVGRFDLFGMSKEHLNWLLSTDPQMKPFKHRVEILQPPYKIFSVHNAITRKREDAQEIVQGFNEGLQKLKLSGRYDDIVKRYKLH